MYSITLSKYTGLGTTEVVPLAFIPNDQLGEFTSLLFIPKALGQ